MPHVVHGDVRIHYSVQGEGPPLILHHGTGSNRTTWIRHGYAKVLRERYRLILMDARGHGQSDKPAALEAHALALRVGDVTTVLDALEIPRAHFLGYSMGGWIAFGMAKHAPERLLSLTIGGAHPFADPAFACLDSIDPRDPAAFLEAMELVVGEAIPEEARNQLLQNDLPAVVATLRQRVALDDVLSQIRVPCWLFAGTADRRYELIVRAQRAITGAELLSLPDLGHLGTLARANLVLPSLTTFLENASNQGES
jgi:pimeloyl-ACP methyl ester carboxylesterase